VNVYSPEMPGVADRRGATTDPGRAEFWPAAGFGLVMLLAQLLTHCMAGRDAVRGMSSKRLSDDERSKFRSRRFREP
jgi:hypothetical protein